MKKLMQSINDKHGEKLKISLRIARIVKYVVCWTLVALLTLAIVVFMITKLSGGTPKFFGYTINRIVSGSMSPELEIGDVIISKEVTDTDEVHIGDIVTFQGGAQYENQKVTHRVLVSPYSDGRGNIVIVTKGDANEVDDGEINFNDVESKYVRKFDFLKLIYNFFFSKWGLIIFIFLLLLIFFDEMLNIVRLIISRGEQEEPETLSQVIERIQREQQESLEQQELTDGKTDDDKSAKSSDNVNSDSRKQEKQEKDKESKKSDSDKKAIVKKKKASKDTKKKLNGNKKKATNNQSNHPKKKKNKSKKKRK